MLLSYADTSRVIEPVLRPRVMSVNGLVSGTFLLDGFVAGVWKLTKIKTSARLEVSAFARLTKPQRQGLKTEGDALLAFAAAELTDREVTLR